MFACFLNVFCAKQNTLHTVGDYFSVHVLKYFSHQKRVKFKFLRYSEICYLYRV